MAPTVPDVPHDPSASALDVMTKIIPWAAAPAIAMGTHQVKKELPSKCPAAKAMHKTPPLAISSEVKEKELSGYKAPWDLETCKTSMKVNGLYEASGLALWLRTGAFRVANTPDWETAPGDVAMETLGKFVETFFSKDSVMKASVLRGAKRSRIGKDRMVWPIEMIVVTDTCSHVEKDGGFDATLNLVGCHFVLWAWYYALFQALQKGAARQHISPGQDKEWIELLWECGSTVTIQARLCTNEKDVPIARIQASEKLKAIGDSSLSDTFLTFSLLCQKLGVEQLSQGTSLKLKFNGSPYNASMHKASTHVLGLMGPNGQGVFHEAMRRLELAWGRDILSNAYSKLLRLSGIAKAAAQGDRNPQQIAAWLVDMLHLCLLSKQTTVAKATEIFLDRDRKRGTHGFWHACLVLLQIFDVAKSLVKTLPEIEAQSCMALIENTIFNPLKCWEDYLKPTGEVAGKAALNEDEEEMSEHGDAAASDSALATVKEKYNRATGCLLDLLVALMNGQHGDSLREISQCGEPIAKMLQPTASTGEEAGQGSSNALVVQLCEVVKAFDSSTKSVSVKSTAPAPSLISTLHQSQPMEELTAERERIWKLVQAERRKFATFSVPKTFKQESLLSAFRACGKAFAHNGTLNSSHRLICASADLLGESGEEPWLAHSKPDAATWKGIADFCASTTGPTDFAMVFDGRMREVRRLNEESLLLQPQSEEMHLVYSGGCVARAGRMRRIPLAARKIETAAVRFPTQRSRVKTSKRENFTSCGEATTFQGSYCGVEFRSSYELPLMALDEKARVLGSAASPAPPEDWRDRFGDNAVPLFWQESKPISFFNAILDEYKIATIFDVTAGSGEMMEASLTRGVIYHGLCLNKEHQQWLQAIADRTACGLITLDGSTLFSEALAADVKKFFPDILESLAPKTDLEEPPLEPDSPGE